MSDDIRQHELDNDDDEMNTNTNENSTISEVERLKKHVAQMEKEAAKLRELQSALEDESGAQESKEDVDSRSVYVGNVDYGASPEELQAHFAPCGSINRITILCDKFTGHPKGFAYVEFADQGLVSQALVLNESEFRGRPLKVTPKRTNLPFMSSRGRGRGRGRGFRGGRGRGGYRGGYRGRGAASAPY